MNTIHPTDAPSLLDVSPVLEYGSPTPLSTHWMDPETLLLPAPVAPLLTAVGHAFFALGRETRALRLHTQAWRAEQECAPAALIQGRLHQAVRHLQEAAHHWSRAAFALDTLRPSDLDPAALARARQLSRIARTQQERLWQLTEEVRIGQATTTHDQGSTARTHRGATDFVDESNRERRESHEQRQAL